MLTLEALQANDGDCFLLHSDGTKPVLILIDGGSKGVYRDVLEKRLDQLCGNRPRLDLRMVVVSHIDADHITGILDMFKQMSESKTDGEAPKWKVASLWHNAFEKVVGSHPASARTAMVAAAAAGTVDVKALKAKGLIDEKAFAVIASVQQGKDLQGLAKNLKTTINAETKGKLIVAPESGRLDIKIADDLSFTVLGPRQAEINDLKQEWEKSKAKLAVDEQAVAADYLNRTVPNLSSIVFLAEQKSSGGKATRFLMTGDAGGDLILKSLKSAKLLDSDGHIKVDVLKVQHHGSNHSVDEDFFRQVIADAYVISGNGKHGIPHMDTLNWLSRARTGKPIEVYMTNRHLQNGQDNLTEGLDKFLAAEAKSQSQHHYHFRKDDALSIVVGD
jgi:beta-lactamase superfamily II metal-dependent hydrolase